LDSRQIKDLQHAFIATEMLIIGGIDELSSNAQAISR